MPADTTIHPFPELRQYAESEARAFAEAWESACEADWLAWDRLDQTTRERRIKAHLTLLCDLTRPASRDAVCRLVADKLGVRVSAGHQMIEEAKGPLSDALPRDVVARIYVTFTEPPTLALIVRHLWPQE